MAPDPFLTLSDIDLALSERKPKVTVKEVINWMDGPLLSAGDGRTLKDLLMAE